MIDLMPAGAVKWQDVALGAIKCPGLNCMTTLIRCSLLSAYFDIAVLFSCGAPLKTHSKTHSLNKYKRAKRHCTDTPPFPGCIAC